jgi:hypothetical protein
LILIANFKFMKCHICGAGGFKGHQGVKMHIGRVHDNTINPNKALKLARKRRNSLARMDGLSVTAIDGEPGVPAVAVAEPPVVVTKRRAVNGEVTATHKKFGVNGCPNCMFPLNIMNTALAAHDIEAPPFCPNCTLPVAVVRTAIEVANKHKPTDLLAQ